MKFAIVVIVSIIATALAQRPWYAGTKPIGYPELADRFKTDEDRGPKPAPNPNDYYNVHPGLPIDAHGDRDLVNRLNQWPRENQPFWLLNANHIEAHRGTHRRPEPYYNPYNKNYRPYGYNNYPHYVNRNDFTDYNYWGPRGNGNGYY